MVLGMTTNQDVAEALESARIIRDEAKKTERQAFRAYKAALIQGSADKEHANYLNASRATDVARKTVYALLAPSMPEYGLV